MHEDLKEYLETAAQLVEDGWTREAFARDAEGIACGPKDSRAVCWCITGAIFKAIGSNFEKTFPLIQGLRNTLLAEGQISIVPEWNDRHCSSKEEAAQILRKAKEYV